MKKGKTTIDPKDESTRNDSRVTTFNFVQILCTQENIFTWYITQYILRTVGNIRRKYIAQALENIARLFFNIIARIIVLQHHFLAWGEWIPSNHVISDRAGNIGQKSEFMFWAINRFQNTLSSWGKFCCDLKTLSNWQ